MASDRLGTVPTLVVGVVACLLLVSIFAPPALGTGIGDATTEAADSIVVDDFPTIGTTVEVVVRLEEASIPASAGETAAERRLETHADST